MNKRVIKLDRAKFAIETIHAPDVILNLDFKAIIETFNLRGNFVLVHWQARPKPWRQWGLYSSKEDDYFSVAKFNCQSRGLSLQLDDRTCQTLPSAVLYYPHSWLSVRSRTATIFGLVPDRKDNQS